MCIVYRHLDVYIYMCIYVCMHVVHRLLCDVAAGWVYINLYVFITIYAHNRLHDQHRAVYYVLSRVPYMSLAIYIIHLYNMD